MQTFIFQKNPIPFSPLSFSLLFLYLLPIASSPQHFRSTADHQIQPPHLPPITAELIAASSHEYCHHNNISLTLIFFKTINPRPLAQPPTPRLPTQPPTDPVSRPVPLNVHHVATRLSATTPPATATQFTLKQKNPNFHMHGPTIGQPPPPHPSVDPTPWPPTLSSPNSQPPHHQCLHKKKSIFQKKNKNRLNEIRRRFKQQGAILRKKWSKYATNSKIDVANNNNVENKLDKLKIILCKLAKNPF